MKFDIFKILIVIGLFSCVGIYAWSENNSNKLTKEKQATELRLQEEKQNAEIRIKEEELEVQKKVETFEAQQKQKEYIAERKEYCYELEKSKRVKWNNVDSGFYRESDDKCVILYTTDEYEGIDCNIEYADEYELNLWMNCISGTFKKEF